jgi:hypothetical protein
MATTEERPRELVALAKVTRLLDTLDAGLTELNDIDPDDEARERLIEAYRTSLVEMTSALSDPLVDELVALNIGPLDPGSSLSELKVAEAQLLGWAMGLVLPLPGRDDLQLGDATGGEHDRDPAEGL